MRMGFLRTKWQDASSAQIMDTWQKWVSIFIFFAYGRGYTHGRKADENTRVKLDKCASVRQPMDNALGRTSLWDLAARAACEGGSADHHGRAAVKKKKRDKRNLMGRY